MAKIKYVALMTGRDVSTIINDSFDDVIAKHEKKSGPIAMK
jgi:hypothetical protein